jgi:hypothetical protein
VAHHPAGRRLAGEEIGEGAASVDTDGPGHSLFPKVGGIIFVFFVYTIILLAIVNRESTANAELVGWVFNPPFHAQDVGNRRWVRRTHPTFDDRVPSRVRGCG